MHKITKNYIEYFNRVAFRGSLLVNMFALSVDTDTVVDTVMNATKLRRLFDPEFYNQSDETIKKIKFPNG